MTVDVVEGWMQSILRKLIICSHLLVLTFQHLGLMPLFLSQLTVAPMESHQILYIVEIQTFGERLLNSLQVTVFDFRLLLK